MFWFFFNSFLLNGFIKLDLEPEKNPCTGVLKRFIKVSNLGPWHVIEREHFVKLL